MNDMIEQRYQHTLKHGHARRKGRPASPEYSTYMRAKNRCTQSGNKHFHRYGGRGIEFRFRSFEEFLAVVGPRPSAQHSLDRYPDNDGHYEPGNVRWATRSQQQNNKSNNPRVTHNGKTLTACEWSKRLGLARNTVRERLYHGWCDSCAVSLPSHSSCAHRLTKTSLIRMITFNGKTQNATAWTREMGLTRGVIAHRLDIGWSVKDALTTPVGRWRK